MASWVEDRVPAEAVAKRAGEVRLRRHREANDALDFLVYGDDEGRHAEKCVHALAGHTPCSREYDPKTDKWGEPPASAVFYEGTGIAAVYALHGSEHHAWQLAGWNVTPRRIAYSHATRGADWDEWDEQEDETYE